ncbi:MAG: sugar-binding domain-containing protein, partial [Chitinophagaceae bacterium]
MKFILLLLLLCSQALFAQQKIRLNNNWEFVRQDLGGIWEAIRPVVQGNPEGVPLWDSVTLPHCVNASDAVDPDVNYYQGPAWYRTLLDVQNPYARGRTLLHFEGSGQKTTVYVYDMKVGEHVGGYDEWTVDITDAIAEFKKKEVYQKQYKGKLPISIRTDNSRDLEIIPSGLSDFNLYGGIYRYLNLVYVPELSIDKLFVHTETTKDGKQGRIQVEARLHNPSAIPFAQMEIKLIDPQGKTVQQVEKRVEIAADDVLLVNWNIKSPQLWSNGKPLLYTVEVVLNTLDN